MLELPFFGTSRQRNQRETYGGRSVAATLFPVEESSRVQIPSVAQNSKRRFYLRRFFVIIKYIINNFNYYDIKRMGINNLGCGDS